MLFFISGEILLDTSFFMKELDIMNLPVEIHGEIIKQITVEETVCTSNKLASKDIHIC